MNGWKFTKVWQVDHKLVVADTINEAVELFKAYMGEDYRDEPYSIRINKHIYTVDYASGYLVRADFIKHVHELGLHTVEKALKRYADANKTKKVLSRLSRIVRARKSPQNDRQLSFEL